MDRRESQISDISSSNNVDIENKYIFLFYTAAQKEDGENITQEKQPLGNFLYRLDYYWICLPHPELLEIGGKFYSIQMTRICM